MTYQTLQEFNQTGISGIFLYVADVVPLFVPIFLFSLFMITMLGTYFSQDRLTGRGNFLSSFAVAGYFTAIVSFVMMLVPNLINTLTVTTTTVIASIGTLLLLSQSKD